MGKENHLDGLEFIFTNIAEDKAGALNVSIYSAEDLIYQTNISLSGLNDWEWKRIFVNAELSTSKEYRTIVKVLA